METDADARSEKTDLKLHGDSVRIGISGWKYPGWRGTFYPPGLPQRCELEFAAKNFNSIEINGTHYSLQRPEYFDRWAAETPDNFVFAVKGSRFITHMKKLRDIEEAMANFFAQGILRLGTKLGPVLWQFPPQFNFDAPKMEAFFALLPRTMEEASHVAEAHGPRLRGRVYTKVEHSTLRQLVRHCVEIRNESFAVPDFIRQLRKHNVGLVIADTVEWPLLMDVTAIAGYMVPRSSMQAGMAMKNLILGPSASHCGPLDKSSGTDVSRVKALAKNIKQGTCMSTSTTT